MSHYFFKIIVINFISSYHYFNIIIEADFQYLRPHASPLLESLNLPNEELNFN